VYYLLIKEKALSTHMAHNVESELTKEGEVQIMKKTLLILGVMVLFAITAMAADSTKVPASPKAKPAATAKKEVKAAKAKGEAKGMQAKEQTSPSGLKWIDEVVGSGAEAAKGDMVDVHYTGWLYENGKKGTKFDSSVDRGQPFSFPLGAGRVIKGWDEGVAGMKVGGKRTLIIPPALGYGANGTPGGPIPGNATLMFDVELLKVTKK
jgi:peptidylprolyl isomerase